MISLIPAVAVPISIKDIAKTISKSVRYSRELLLNDFNSQVSHLSNFKCVRTFQSGYLALYVLLKYLGHKYGKTEVIVSAYTCPSVYFAIKNAGLKPVFADIDLESFNISCSEIEGKVNSNTLAVIVAHMFGGFSSIGEVRAMLNSLNQSNVVIIEDLCQALSNLNKIKETTLEYGDYGIMSFGRAKSISTLNGGALVTNDNNEFSNIQNSLPKISKGGIIIYMFQLIKLVVYSMAVRPYLYRIPNFLLRRKRRRDPFNLLDYRKIDHSDLGELQTLQVSLGLQMLLKLDSMNKIRKSNSEFYSQYFDRSDLFLTQANNRNVYLRFPVVFKNLELRTQIEMFLFNRGMLTSTANYPVLSTIEKGKADSYDKEFENASTVASGILTLPTHPYFNSKKFVKSFNEFFNKNY